MATRRLSDDTLTEAESALCDSIIETLVRIRQDELRAMYEIARKLREHQRTVQSDLRGSLERCARRLGWNRTTLLRYSFVPQRVHPPELERLAALRDAQGNTPSFWDIVQVAKCSVDERLSRVSHRVQARNTKKPRRAVGQDFDE